MASTRHTNPIPYLIGGAFKDACEAEAILYASGASREVKDRIIRVHSDLLWLKNKYPVRT